MSASHLRKISPDGVDKIEHRVFYPLLMNTQFDKFHSTVRYAAQGVKDNRFRCLRDVENLFRNPSGVRSVTQVVWCMANL